MRGVELQKRFRIAKASYCVGQHLTWALHQKIFIQSLEACSFDFVHFCHTVGRFTLVAKRSAPKDMYDGPELSAVAVTLSERHLRPES